MRARERKTRDLGIVRCINNENGKVLSEDAEIKERWQRYFFKLLTKEASEDPRSTGSERSEMGHDLHLGEPISRGEIKEALKRMPNGKAEGSDRIPVEVLG